MPLNSKSNEKHPTGILYYELLSLVHCQYRLIHDGYFMRGGVTIGDICFEDEMVFGPALVQAYALESEFAIYPRIVLDPKLFIALENEPLIRNDIHDVETEFIGELIRRDTDGLYFVDYLRGMLSEFDEEGGEIEFLALHKDRILEHAPDHDILYKVSAKFLWLATYHNECIRRIGADQFSDRDLDIDDFLIHHDDLPLVYEMDKEEGNDG